MVLRARRRSRIASHPHSPGSHPTAEERADLGDADGREPWKWVDQEGLRSGGMTEGRCGVMYPRFSYI